jgi:RluA family pseudouridine synthase
MDDKHSPTSDMVYNSQYDKDNNIIMIPEIDLKQIIISEDESIIALNKPAGVLTIPGGFSQGTPDLKSELEASGEKIWVIHRLDKDTSGVVLFAKNADVHRNLNGQFDQREINKEYRAIVYGTPRWNNTSSDQSLLVDGDRSHRTIVSSLGKSAKTDFEVLHRFPCFTYLTARPHSGLTHQIRAHLAHLSYPILQDALYAKDQMLPEDSSLIPRMALHAYQIKFCHPLTGEDVILTAPIPADFRFALDKLPEIKSHEEADYNKIYNTVVYQVNSQRKRKK